MGGVIRQVNDFIIVCSCSCFAFSWVDFYVLYTIFIGSSRRFSSFHSFYEHLLNNYLCPALGVRNVNKRNRFSAVIKLSTLPSIVLLHSRQFLNK